MIETLATHIHHYPSSLIKIDIWNRQGFVSFKLCDCPMHEFDYEKFELGESYIAPQKDIPFDG